MHDTLEIILLEFAAKCLKPVTHDPTSWLKTVESDKLPCVIPYDFCRMELD